MGKKNLRNRNLRCAAVGIKFPSGRFMPAAHRNLIFRISDFGFRVFISVVCLLSFAFGGLANPTGMTVASGSASARQNGARLTVTASQNAFLNWRSFNIAAGEATIFQQPSAQSIVWNRVNDPSPSQIFGSLQANGIVVLMNSSGFYFGPNSFVSAAGLVVSTAPVGPRGGGGSWEFTGPPPTTSIINFGKINISPGGSAFLIADNVANYGSITAPGGNIGLGAGQQVMLSQRPDGRGLSMKVNLPEGSVDNYGHITADAGTIVMHARTVNQNGFVQANSARDQNGVIELVAADDLNLGANSQISARGDDSTPASSGGNVTLKSGNTFSDTEGSQISIAGGVLGGNGGNVEISAQKISAVHSQIDGRAQPSWIGGKFLLDPDYIVLGQSGGAALNISGASGSLLVGYSPGSTLFLNVGTGGNNFLDSAFLGLSQITLQAKYDITLATGTMWDLSSSTGQSSGHLDLWAGNNIIFQNGSSIFDANNWSVTLKAGVNDFTTGAIQPGVGNIFLNGGSGAFGGGSIQTAAGSINLAAGQNIEAGNGSFVDANFNSVAIASGSGNVSLSAGNNIQTGFGYIETTGGGKISMTAGQDVQAGIFSGIAATGGGSINVTATAGSLKDAGVIQTDSGSVNVLAGQDVSLSGFSSAIVTMGGGNIDVTAVAGSVNTGINPNGYFFTLSHSPNPLLYYTVFGSILGGISTAAGGNVRITAGQDIISYLPKGNNPAGDAGSGAFGQGLRGNVTLTAGRNVEGHYVVADGKGTINAGADIPLYLATKQVVLSNPDGNAGTTPAEVSTPLELALSLINGGWIVNAAHNINLQEVRNPNGTFNGKGNSFSLSYHHFDYGPGDYVCLNAGNTVELFGDNLPRNSGENNLPPIYPGTLNINANTIILGNKIILFPSPLGSLNITTTGGPFETSAYANYLQQLAAYNPAGGNLPPVAPTTQIQLIMSDSSASQWTSIATFGDGDHAAVPVHLNSFTPVTLNIAGSMDDINLVVPEAAQIAVGGDMNNCAFKGQNLSSDPNQTVQVQARQADGSKGPATIYPGLTRFTVGGDILNQNIFNSVQLTSDPDLALLNLAFGANYSELFNRLFYNSSTKTLTLQGVLTSDELNALTNLKIVVLNALGVPEVDIYGNPVLENVSILPVNVVQLLQAESRNAPATPNPGYILGGGGTFDITAHTLDLGATFGLQTVGPANNAALARYSRTGADINLNLSGDLDMFATTVSTLNGGNIFVNAAGAVNVGSKYIPGNDQYARGIYTTGDGNVNVVSGGNIEVNGSRIAAYDGGNVFVKSLNGVVDAGTGGNGSAAVQQYYVDASGQIFSFSPVIPGSGILAMTFPPPDSFFPAPEYTVGNILIEAPNGDIIANSGGIVQFPLNGGDSSSATVTLLAGEDAAGKILSPNRNIDVSGSGVIGSQVTLKASGSVNGVIFARNSANVDAQQNANVTVLSEGNATVSAGGNISGTIIGIGSVTASGSSVDASLLSQNVTASGNVTGQVGFTAGTAANAASAGLSNDQTTKAVATDQTDDDKKKGKGPGVAQKVSRVTVILPPKKMSEAQTPNSGT
jgi:filamentous hemagglutinin family protein